MGWRRLATSALQENFRNCFFHHRCYAEENERRSSFNEEIMVLYNLRLVKDIFFGPESSYPELLTVLGDQVFFTAYDGFHGEELWKSDGTVPGTVLVKDIYPGPGSGFPYPFSGQFTVAGDRLFFTANDGVHDVELWTSLGTESSTRLVRDINPEPTLPWVTVRAIPDVPWSLIARGSTLFFHANDGVHGGELWSSDGMEGGTRIVRDVQPGPAGSSARTLIVRGQDLFFSADDGRVGSELWITAGSESTSDLVKDIHPGPGSSNPSFPTVFNNTILFFANDGVHGQELWVSNGSEAGTALIKDIYPGPEPSIDNSFPQTITSLDENALFIAFTPDHGRELWRTDGTEAGTVLVKDINPGTENSNPRGLVSHDGSVFFFADDGVHGRELWRTDGTEAGTVLVSDIFPGPEGSDPFSAASMVSFGDQLLVAANDGVHGDELWRSDGTASGTFLYRDIHPGPEDSTPGEFTVTKASVFFHANDGVHGTELWQLTDASILRRDVNGDGAEDLVVAAGPCGGPHVRVLSGRGGRELAGFFAYDPGFGGGVDGALADVNGDGRAEVITAAGPGGGPHVKVFGADTDAPLRSFYAFEASFGGGVRVAGGDINNDGFDDILTGAGSGGGSRVKVFSGRDGGELRSFSAYEGFNGPIDIAGGDVDGDGFTDIITGAGSGGGPHVKVFSGASGEQIGGFFAFDSTFAGGVQVAAGDLDGDGRDEIIVGAGPGARPEVKVFRADGTLLGGFLAYGAGFPGGVDVTAFDGDGDGRSELATGAGPGGGPHLRAFGEEENELFALMAFEASFSGGVIVG